jgi:hypothetical protein
VTSGLTGESTCFHTGLPEDTFGDTFTWKVATLKEEDARVREDTLMYLDGSEGRGNLCPDLLRP